MRKLKKRKIDRRMLKPMEVDYDRIDAYILKKYRLADIEKKDVFVLLNLLFMAGGIISIVSFLYESINAVSITGGVVTLIIGFAITTMIKKGAAPPAHEGTTNSVPGREKEKTIVSTHSQFISKINGVKIEEKNEKEEKEK